MKRIRSADPKTILKGALAKIKRGWCQGRTYKPGRNPEYCVFGAIYSCSHTGLSGGYDLAADAAERTFYEANKINISIALWNDNPYRKKSDVVAAFKKAIKSLK